MAEEAELPALPEIITIKEAARTLGLSRRMVHSYVQDGRLPGYKVGKRTIAIKMEDLATFQRGGQGRPRTRLPVWRKSKDTDPQYVSFMQARVKPGMQQGFEERLELFRLQFLWLLPGTVARYIACGGDNVSSVQVILIWRGYLLPGEEERAEAIRALKADLADLLDWDTEHEVHGKVLLHT